MGFTQHNTPPAVWAALQAAAAQQPAPAKPVAKVARAKPVPVPAPVSAALRVEFTLSVALVNPLNRREHWAARCRRVRAERDAVCAAWLACPVLRCLCPSNGAPVRWRVALTRLGGRKFDDDGNTASLKGIRDEVAASLCVDDGDERITFAPCAWEPGKAVGVRVLIEAA